MLAFIRASNLGYDAHRGQHFENDLMGTMRKARDVAEHLFYGR